TPDEDALAENGLTEDDISTALDASGLSLPGGSVVDGERTLDVVLGQDLDSIESLEQIVLIPADDGAQQDQQQPGQQQAPPEPVTLAEVADVERTTEEPTSISRTDGRESLVVMVTATA